MIKDRIQIPCLDKRGIEGKRIYNYRQWVERFKQYAKNKYNIDIGHPIKERTISETKGNMNEKKIQQDFLWALGSEVTHQTTRYE